MKRNIWVLTLLIVCGCAGRMNTDLLQARIREQASQLADTQREVAKTKAELKQSRFESEQLKAELSHNGHNRELTPQSNVQISKLHIYPLASGGLNKDDQPGDDAVVVQFAPFDGDNEPVKLPGQLQFTLIDPSLPVAEQTLGQWKYSAKECSSHWTRGITSSGFQFTLPLEQQPEHTDLVVKLVYKTNDDKYCEASQIVKVMVPPAGAVKVANRQRKRLVQVVDELDEQLPPVGDRNSNPAELDWADDDRANVPTKSGHTVLHSSSWTDKYPTSQIR